METELSSNLNERVERKFATILFIDLADSVRLLQGMDVEDAGVCLTTVLSFMENIVSRNGGVVASRQGDGILAVFGAPSALENHEIRAITAALEIHQDWNTEGGCGLFKETPSFYTSAHCGEILSRQVPSQTEVVDVFGDTVHIAARMTKLIGPNVVVITEEVKQKIGLYSQIVKIGDFEFRGYSGRKAVYRVDAINHSALDMHGARERKFSPFVGRDNELSWLLERLQSSIAGNGGVYLISAEAGAGKSRLLHEFRRETENQDLYVFRTRCENFGETLAYAPLKNIIRSLFIGVDRSVRENKEVNFAKIRKKLQDNEHCALAIDALIGNLHQQSPWQKLSSVRKAEVIESTLSKLFLLFSQAKPVLIEIEDAHWSDAETLRWLAAFRKSIESSKILVCVSSRQRSSSVSVPRFWSEDINLRLLDTDSLDKIIRNSELLNNINDSAVERITTLSGGNPLFAEECTKFLEELGSEANQIGSEEIEELFRSRIKGSDTQSILAARLDELPAEVREVIAASSAVGVRFDDKIVESALNIPAERLMAALQSLLDAEILFPSGSSERDRYRFKHAITHEVVYRTITRHKRSHYHRSILDAYEDRFGSSAFEHADLLREHAKKAGDVVRAVRYQRHSALAALERSANVGCLKLLRECIELARSTSESLENLRLQIDLNFDLRNCLEIIDPNEIFHALRDAEELCDRVDDRLRRTLARSYLTHAHWVAGRLNEAFDYGEMAVKDADRLNEPSIKIPAQYHLSLVKLSLGRHADAAQSFAEVIEAADRQNEPIQHQLNVAPAVLARSYLARCLAEMAQHDEARAVAMAARDQAKNERENYAIAFAELALGHASIAEENYDSAVDWLSKSMAGFEASEADVMQPISQSFLGYALALSKDYDAALPMMRSAVAETERLSVWEQQGLRTAFISEAQIGLGDLESAEQTLDNARSLSIRHNDTPALAFIDYQSAKVFLCANGEFDSRSFELIQDVIKRAKSMQMYSLTSQCERLMRS